MGDKMSEYAEMIRQRDELDKQIAESRKQAYQDWFNKMMDEAAQQGFTVTEVFNSVKRRMPRK